MSPDHAQPWPAPAMQPSLQRELRARGQRLKARLTLGNKGLTEPFLAEVRAELHRSDLIKVRIEADDRQEAEQQARLLAARVPCHLVQWIGRVALLYLARPAAAPKPAP